MKNRFFAILFILSSILIANKAAAQAVPFCFDVPNITCPGGSICISPNCSACPGCTVIPMTQCKSLPAPGFFHGLCCFDGTDCYPSGSSCTSSFDPSQTCMTYTITITPGCSLVPHTFTLRYVSNELYAGWLYGGYQEGNFRVTLDPITWTFHVTDDSSLEF